MKKLIIISENTEHLQSIKALVADALPEMSLLTAVNGPQGIELAQTEDPDIMFLDVALSEMSSFEICRKLKTDPQLKSIPVVFLTTLDTDKASLSKAFEIGADAFLSLPIEAFNLKLQIRALSKLKVANLCHLCGVKTNILDSLNTEITRQVHVGIIVYGADHRYLVWNPFMEKLTGLRAEAVLGKRPLELFPFLDAQGMSARINQALSGIPTEPIEFPFFITETGRLGWVQDSNSPLYNAKGEVIAVVATVQDITTRKLAEDAAVASKDFLDSIINTIGQPVFVKDEQHRFLLANDAFCSLFDLNRNQIIGKTLDEQVPLDEHQRITKIDNKVLLSGEKSIVEEALTVHENIPMFFLTTKTRYINKKGEKFLIAVVQDLTERKKLENAFRRNSFLLEASQEIAKVGGWELDLTTNQLFWTAETYRIHDTSPAEFNPTVDAGVSYYSPESRKQLSEALQAAIEYGKGYDLILEMFTTKGCRIDVRTTCVVTCEQGRPIKLTGIFQDITQQKQAEAELRAKDLQFRKLSDNIPDLIFQFTRRSDGSYCVPIASKGIENIFGCTPEDVKEDFTPIARVIHPEDSARVIDDIEYSAQHLSYFTCEFRVQVPGRDTQWILSRSNPEKLPDGSVTWFGFNIDITKQKQTEQKLEEYRHQLEQLVNIKTDELQTSERNFRNLVEGVKQDYIFYMVDKDSCFTYLSPSAETIIGLSMEQMIGRPWYEVLQVARSEWQAIRAKSINLKKHESLLPFELQACFKGELQTLEINHHVIFDDQDKPFSSEGVIKNITRQKEIEQKLRDATESAKIASQAKSMFLANMSHEIRTPMNAILGFTELMQEQSRDPRFQKYLEAINSSGKTLLKIINEILDLSKIESGKLILNPEPVHLIQIIEELKVLFERSFAEKGLYFEAEISSEIPDYLELDAIRLRQVLINLLGNALKFTSVGGVHLKIVFSPQNVDSGCLTLAIQDTGIGISEENQRRIFKAFEQVSDSQRSFSSGTGLGLTISQSLIHLMGGELQVQSILGQGTCFTVVLPDVHIVESVTVEAIQTPVEMNLFLPAHILIADDVPENLLLLESMLEFSPFEVTLAHNGREACEIADMIHPDLILMDIKMPVMDGVQAVQQLKNKTKTRMIPVIALTAYSLKQDQESLLQKGFDAYLSKPVQKSDLLRCLKDFLPMKEINVSTDLSLTEPVLSSVQLSSQEVKHLQQILNEHWLPRWRVIKDSLVIDELDSFANELLVLAKQYHLVSLQHFAEGLLSQINLFALEQAQTDLSGFPRLLESILLEVNKN